MYSMIVSMSMGLSCLEEGRSDKGVGSGGGGGGGGGGGRISV